MYGELYFKPWELAKTTFIDVVLSLKGRRNKDLYDQLLLRRSTFIIASSFGGRSISSKMDKLWPVPKEARSGKIPESALKQLRHFKTIEAQKNLINATGTSVKDRG